MAENQEIAEKLKAGMSVAQLEKQGYKRWRIYKIKKDLLIIKQGESIDKRAKTPKKDSLSGSADIEIENEPEILALKKELRKAELERQLAEIKVPIGLESRIEALEEEVKESLSFSEHLLGEIADIMSILAFTPLAGLGDKFECNCGAKGQLAIKVQCSICGKENNYEWHAPGQYALATGGV
ncbi:hypothetical protein ACFLUO_07285 [Chloroflexota bacterium]